MGRDDGMVVPPIVGHHGGANDGDLPCSSSNATVRFPFFRRSGNSLQMKWTIFGEPTKQQANPLWRWSGNNDSGLRRDVIRWVRPYECALNGS